MSIIIILLVFLIVGCKKDSNPVKDTPQAPAGMVYVAGGTFTMGKVGLAEPIHQVSLSNFYLSKTEVTQGQWKAVMGGVNPSYFIAVGDSAPVEQVSWYDCINYCNKLSIKEGKPPVYSVNGYTNPDSWPTEPSQIHPVQVPGAKGYRLPTEAEWEYAARGGAQSHSYTNSGSNNEDSVAWYNGNADNTTHRVSTKPPNELGLYDMSGNVWEWCWDWYGGYATTLQTNPAGSTIGVERVLRGGSWWNDADYCRTSRRGALNPVDHISSYGLRVLLDF